MKRFMGIGLAVILVGFVLAFVFNVAAFWYVVICAIGIAIVTAGRIKAARREGW